MSTPINRVRNTVRNLTKSIKKKLSSEAVSKPIDCAVKELVKEEIRDYDLVTDQIYHYDLREIGLPPLNDDAGSRAAVSADEVLNEQLPPYMVDRIIQVNKKPLLNAEEKTVAQRFREAFTDVQPGLVEFLVKAVRPGVLYDPSSALLNQLIGQSYVISPGESSAIKVKFEVQKDGSIIVINNYSASYMRAAEAHLQNPEKTRVNIRMIHKITMENGEPKVSIVDRAFNVVGTNEQDLNTIGTLLAAKLEVKCKADPKNMNGKALLEAAASGNLGTIKILLKAGIQRGIKDYQTGTALHYAANFRNHAVALKMVEALIEHSEKADEPNTLGQTALHYAAKAGNDSLIVPLIMAGADINKADNQGATVLHDAAKAGEVAFIQTLLQKSSEFFTEECQVNINARDNEGRTALHYAAEAGEIEVLRFLIPKMDINLADSKGKTPLHYAKESGNNEAVRLLRGHGATTAIVLKDIPCLQLEASSNTGDISEFPAPMDFEHQTYMDLQRDAADITIGKDPIPGKTLRELFPGLSDKNEKMTEQEQMESVRKILWDAGFDEEVIAAFIKNFNQGNLHAHLQTNIYSSLAGYRIGYPGYVLMDKKVYYNIQWIEGGGARIIETLSGSAFDSIAADDVLATIRGKSSTTIKVVNGEVEFHIENIEVEVIENIEAKDSAFHVGHIRDRIIDGLYSKANLFVYARTGSFNHIEEAVTEGQLTDKNINIPDRAGKTLLHHAAKRGHLDIVALLLVMGAESNIPDASGKTAEIYLKELPNADTAMLEIINILKNPDDAKDVNIQNREGKTALHFAALAGNYELIGKLLAKNANLALKDKKGHTPLHCAAIAGNIQVFDKLVNAGKEAALTVKDNTGKMPLHYAAEMGNVDIIKRLAKISDLKLNETDSDKKTALHYAALKDKVDAAKILLMLRPDVNLQDSHGKTALHYAASMSKQNTLMLKALLDAKADLSLTDLEKQTPLHCAAQSNTAEAIRLLLERGADIDARDNDQRTALQQAVRVNTIEAVEAILSFNPNLELQSSEGKSALHYAATRKDINVLRLLVSKGANIACTDEKGKGVLHHAVEVGNVEAVELLVVLPKTHFSDENGRTALYYVSQPRLVQILVKKGIDVNHQDKQGQTSLHHAIVNDQLAVIEELLKVSNLELNARDNLGKTALHYAVEKRDAALVSLLLKADINADVKDNLGRTALHYAVEKGNAVLVKALLEAKADVNLQDNQGRTALHYAVEKENITLIEALLEAGAAVNFQDNEGKSILHDAVKKGSDELVRALLKVAVGMNVDLQDNEGKTALHYAVEMGKVEIVKELLAADAPIDAKDAEGKIAIDYANEKGNTVIASLIKEHEKHIAQIPPVNLRCEIKTDQPSDHKHLADIRVIPIMDEVASKEQQNADAKQDYPRVQVQGIDLSSECLFDALKERAPVEQKNALESSDSVPEDFELRQKTIDYLTSKGVNPTLAPTIADTLNQKSLLQFARTSINSSVSLDRRFGNYVTHGNETDKTLITVVSENEVRISNLVQMVFVPENASSEEHFRVWAHTSHTISLDKEGKLVSDVAVSARVVGENAAVHAERIQQGFTASAGLYFDARRGMTTVADSITSDNINKVDAADNTMLYYALKNGHIKYAAFLIEKGANIKLVAPELLQAKDQYSKTLLSYISQTKDLVEIVAIIDKGNKKPFLQHAIEAGNFALTKQLLTVRKRFGEDTIGFSANKQGQTALHYAAIAYAKAVKESQQEIQGSQHTIAAEKDRRLAALADAEAIILALVDAGADATMKDKTGKAPYQQAQGPVQTYLYLLTGVEGYIQHLTQSGVKGEKLKVAKAMKAALTSAGSLPERLANFEKNYKPEAITAGSTGLISRLSSRFKRMTSDRTQDIIHPRRDQTHAQAFAEYIGNRMKSVSEIVAADEEARAKAQAVEMEEEIEIIPLDIPEDYLQKIYNSQEPQKTDPIAVESGKPPADDLDSNGSQKEARLDSSAKEIVAADEEARAKAQAKAQAVEMEEEIEIIPLELPEGFSQESEKTTVGSLGLDTGYKADSENEEESEIDSDDEGVKELYRESDDVTAETEKELAEKTVSLLDAGYRRGGPGFLNHRPSLSPCKQRAVTPLCAPYGQPYIPTP